jgi:uncharacterized membrane protein required for colicin V production
MTTEMISNFNWVDILMGVILIRAVFVGAKRGIVIEAFKLVGIIFTVFITLHYYSGMSKLLQDKMHLPQGAGDLFSFSVLWGLINLVFKLIRDGFLMLFKMEAAHSILDKWGGLFLAVLRGFLICSLAILCMRASTIEYLTKNLEKSLTASKLVGISPRVYESCYTNFVSKFFPTEELNKSVFKLADLTTEKKKDSRKK